MNFYKDMKNGEEFANVSCTLEVYAEILKSKFTIEKDFRLNSIKQKNEEHKESELLQRLYKELRALKDKISIEEQKINHK